MKQILLYFWGITKKDLPAIYSGCAGYAICQGHYGDFAFFFIAAVIWEIVFDV